MQAEGLEDLGLELGKGLGGGGFGGMVARDGHVNY